MNIQFPSEKFIEDYVWSKIDKGDVCPITQDAYSERFRQVNLDSYGIADLILAEGSPGNKENPLHIEFTVLELKNEIMKPKDLGQTLRYMKALKVILSKYSKRMGFSYSVKGVLAGLSNSDLDFKLLAEACYGVSVFEIALNVDDGFQSTELDCGWRMAEFSESKVKEIRAMYESLCCDYINFKNHFTGKEVKNGENKNDKA